MSRHGKVFKRELAADPKYKNRIIAKLINTILKEGKKSIAERIVYTAMDIASQKVGVPQLAALKQAIENIKPVLEVKARRVGGATYQVPVDVRADRRITLAIRWLVDSAKGRNEKTMEERLAGELSEAYNKTGNAMKKREDTHKMAEANRAFAHYRW
ncbi:MAG: 30S ribosomal protein S7 [Candidatus Firestonebacteria bacterium]